MQRLAIGDRSIYESVDLAHRQDTGLETAQHGSPTFCAEIKREIRIPSHGDRMI
jgi:hypothetical protein